MALENEVIPEVLVSERAATVFKEACQAEGKNLEQSFLRIGAKPGGCSGWKYELEWNGPEDIHSEDLTLKSGEISVVVERECLTDILGPVKIDFTNKNLVEQGFVFEQLDGCISRIAASWAPQGRSLGTERGLTHTGLTRSHKRVGRAQQNGDGHGLENP